MQGTSVIPAKTTVLGSHWYCYFRSVMSSHLRSVARSILHDAEVFPEPEVFKPDRWLNEKGEIRDDIKMLGFGFGRR